LTALSTPVSIRPHVAAFGLEGAVLKHRLALCVLALSLSTNVFAQNAPSFDCSKAATADEHAVCGNARLSELDRLVAAGYQYVRQQYGDAEAKRIGRPLLQLRRSCLADEACIEEKQLFAIKQFQSLGAALISITLPQTQNPLSAAKTTVQLKSDGGVFTVPVEINGAITLDFIIDSGASDVSLPADVVSTLIRTGTIQSTDFIGKQTYVLADGSAAPSAVFTIRSLKIGDYLIANVRGSIAPAQGTLLLGQSFLQNFKSWSVDNAKHALILEAP
jgi:clan AA aspartic protease (TIGR02281 family)